MTDGKNDAAARVPVPPCPVPRAACLARCRRAVQHHTMSGARHAHDAVSDDEAHASDDSMNSALAAQGDGDGDGDFSEDHEGDAGVGAGAFESVPLKLHINTTTLVCLCMHKAVRHPAAPAPAGPRAQGQHSGALPPAPCVPACPGVPRRVGWRALLHAALASALFARPISVLRTACSCNKRRAIARRLAPGADAVPGLDVCHWMAAAADYR